MLSKIIQSATSQSPSSSSSAITTESTPHDLLPAAAVRYGVEHAELNKTHVCEHNKTVGTSITRNLVQNPFQYQDQDDWGGTIISVTLFNLKV